ncbi:MAG: GTPase ObgE [Pseudomonadales bacterium]|nr:GTPase ObgE [Pseudomonadales bacterium]
MIDLVKLILVAGDGGLGRVSFRRERRITKGGPDGGDGGKGGSIILRGDKNLATLKAFQGKVLYESEDGVPGGKKNKIGAKGQDLILDVPIGTQISVVAESGTAKKRRMFVGINSLLSRDDVRFEKYYLEKEGQGIPARDVDNFYLPGGNEPILPDVQEVLNATKGAPLIELATITEHNQEIVICQGGFGGRGNDRFKNSRNTTPLEAEYGTFGEKRAVLLELKLLADVGLVGFPNAGKSTILSVITKARPKIASYPFTTIEPNLGILDFGDYQVTSGLKEVVLADIPGLIEGASEGKGLGHSFLRHVENCSTMLFVLALTEEEVFDETITNKQKAKILYKQLKSLKTELKNHGLKSENSKILKDKKFFVSINKTDLYSKELIAEIKREFKSKKIEVIFFSAATKVGIDVLAGKLREIITCLD